VSKAVTKPITIQKPSVPLSQAISRPQVATTVQSNQQIVMEDEPIVVPPVLEKAKEDTAPYDLESNLKLTIKAQKKIIKLNSKEQQIMPVLVNVKTEDLTEEQ
jgi:hypothetical protein